MLKNSSKLHLILKIYRFKRYSRTVNSFATQVACNRGIWKLLRRTHATHLKPPLPETCVACKFPSCDTNSRNLSIQKNYPLFVVVILSWGIYFSLCTPCWWNLTLCYQNTKLTPITKFLNRSIWLLSSEEGVKVFDIEQPLLDETWPFVIKIQY